MVFNSLIYLFFLIATATAYYIIPSRFRWIWLLLASIAYYLSFIPVFFGLLAFIVIINFFLGKWIANQAVFDRKKYLTIIVIINLIILAFFKYFHFFFLGFRVNLYFVDWFYRVDPLTTMIVPLGLSYLVFTVLSYQIELKRNTIQPEQHFGYFSLYLLFFPKIAQGPIERPQTMLSQIRQSHEFDYENIVEGLKLIVWGYFKKLVVADRLAIYVNAVYGNVEYHTGLTFIVATIFYSFQIYADFSGYTDIALGTAQVFGFKLTNNFKRPYFATSIKDFWNRWHISFSYWLRDYLFLPLAYYFSRKMKKEKYLSIQTEKWIFLFSSVITFAICGIWHGEGINYLIWGLLFGLFLSYSNWTSSFNKLIRKKLHISKTSRFYIFYKTLFTFTLVSFAFIFFRANDANIALSIFDKLLTHTHSLFIDTTTFFYGFIGIFILITKDILNEYIPNSYKFFRSDAPIISALATSLIIITILSLGVFDGGQFIYFQF